MSRILIYLKPPTKIGLINEQDTDSHVNCYDL